MITEGRRRAGKGRYHLRRADLETGLCACLALLLPEDTQRDEEEARWLARRFPGRAWIAIELLRGGADRARLRRLEGLGLPLCAAGDVHMHSRERRPLQDTLTAIWLPAKVRAQVEHELDLIAELV